MNQYESPDFTVDKGMELQAKNLAGWKERLKPHVYDALVAETAARTLKSKLRNGYDVPRGSDIDFIAMNVEVPAINKFQELFGYIKNCFNFAF